MIDDTVGQGSLKCGGDKNVKKDGTQVGRNEDRKAQGWSADVMPQRRRRYIAYRFEITQVVGKRRKQKTLWKSERK